MNYMTPNNWKIKQCRKIEFRNKTSRVMIFFILYFSQSIMFRELVPARFTILLITLIWFILLFFSWMLKEHLYIGFDCRQLIIFFTLSGCIALSCACNGLNITFDGYTIILLFLAILLVSTIERKEFILSYIDVMCFIGFTSSVLFLSYKIIPNAFNIFPDYYWHGDILIKNCYLCAIPISMHNYRNFGVFYEPGMFSLFLIWALLFSLFHVKINVKKIVILLFALGTTLSTNGYLCGISLIVLFAFFNRNISKSQKKLVCLIFAIGCIVVVFYLIRNLDALDFLLSKFNEIHIKETVSRNVSGSGYERWRSVIYAIECFLNNPALGVGATGWQIKFTSVIGTATPLNWFGIYGFLYGSILFYLYCKSITFIRGTPIKNYLVLIGLIIIGLMNVMTQNVSTDITMFMIMLYGIGTIPPQIIKIEKENMK